MQIGEDQQPRRTLAIFVCLLLAVGPHSLSTAQTARRGTVRDTAALRAAMLTAIQLAAEADPVAAHGKQPGAMGAKPRGENLWTGSRGAYSYAAMARAWLDERVHYVDGVMPDISSSGNWLDVGHYSQMIWKTTTMVGCAVVSDARRDLLVCRYDPPGNIAGRNPLTGARRP
ncbi:hypothetical protein FHS91_002045 [Sphingobium xanthum]|uniref:CAP domain-containing protein n=1 Tax=Sphingobium xanthum TaxID=1387165 RepID=UPI001C8C4EAA|nr:CAP domain-containing protein [Sphingobium xanthum]